MRRSAHSLALTAILVLANCGGFNAASQLRLYLSASGPLISSLPLSDSLKSGLVVDFTDLASGAATMAEEFKACGSDKPCKLNAVDKFQVRFFGVERRGHFGSHAKLQTVKDIIAGIISSARIYYGARQNVTAGGSPRVVTEADLKAKLDELKAAMQP
jgi:hypothetical protein